MLTGEFNFPRIGGCSARGTAPGPSPSSRSTSPACCGAISTRCASWASPPPRRPGCRLGVAPPLAYGAAVLGDPANALGLFPQGRIRHPAERPLGFQRGLERILRAHGAPVAILPLAMRCEYYEHQRPDALFLFDRVLTAGPGAFPQVGWLEQRVAALVGGAGRGGVGRR